jgi:hypothetical protein
METPSTPVQARGQHSPRVQAPFGEEGDVAESLLQQGFRLAHFIIGNRELAIQILCNSTRKLRVQHSREKKRVYWRKALKHKITRIVRTEEDTLQWLIYLESAWHEKQQETEGEQTTRDMVVRYIKHLVQITTSMSSFYVNVGLQRLLFNYSTADSQKAYEWLTEHYTDAVAYRTVKAALMKEIAERFKDTVQICRTHHGEQRFETLGNQSCWMALVKRCLRMFIPWSTLQACSATLRTELACGSQLSTDRNHGLPQDTLELRRCHTFIDPDCYEDLTKKVGLDSPSRRLALPRFINCGREEENSSGDPGNDTMELTSQEVQAIRDVVAEDALLRQQASPRFLRIRANGMECSRLNIASAESRAQCSLKDGTKLLEVWWEHDGRDVLLGLHWIDSTLIAGVARSVATVDIGNGRELLIETSPAAETQDHSRSILVRLECRPVSRLEAWKESLKWDAPRFRGLAQYAVTAVLLIAIGWMTHTIKRDHDRIRGLTHELAVEKSARVQAEKSLSSELNRQLLAYELEPDDSSTRSGQGQKETVITLPSRPDVIVFDMPVENGSQASYRAVLRNYLENKEIASEGFLKPTQSASKTVVQFALASVLMESGQHYSVDLYLLSRTGISEKTHSFSVYVSKR